MKSLICINEVINEVLAVTAQSINARDTFSFTTSTTLSTP